jgi:hypothetical protein
MTRPKAWPFKPRDNGKGQINFRKEGYTLAREAAEKALAIDPCWKVLLRRVDCAPEQLDVIEFEVTLPQQGGKKTLGHH